MIPLNRVGIKSVKFKGICFRVIVKRVVHAQIPTTIHANTYGGIYPEEISALQRDYSALWGPLSDLLKQLSALVEL